SEAIQDQPSVSRSASPQPPSWTIALARNLLNTIQPPSRLGFSKTCKCGTHGSTEDYTGCPQCGAPATDYETGRTLTRALALPTVVREAQERKGFRLSFTTLLPILGGEPPKFDQSCFLRM